MTTSGYISLNPLEHNTMTSARVSEPPDTRLPLTVFTFVKGGMAEPPGKGLHKKNQASQQIINIRPATVKRTGRLIEKSIPVPRGGISDCLVGDMLISTTWARWFGIVEL